MKSAKATSTLTIVMISSLSNAELILFIVDAYLLFYSFLPFMDETRGDKHLPPLCSRKKKKKTPPNVLERIDQIAP